MAVDWEVADTISLVILHNNTKTIGLIANEGNFAFAGHKKALISPFGPHSDKK
jgi:hypothetical protein